MKFTKVLFLLFLIFCFVDPLLLLLDHIVWNRNMTTDTHSIFLLERGVSIIGISTIFCIYTIIELICFIKIKEGQEKLLVSFYLGTKILRLFVSIILFISYVFLIKKYLIPFALDLFAFYVITVVFTSIYYMKSEQKIKNQ